MGALLRWGLCAVLLVASPAFLASPAFAQSHGGRMVETRLAVYELVATKDVVTIYVDLKGKRSFSVKGAVATFEVINANGQVVERSKLLPGDGNALISRGPFRIGPGSKIVAKIKFNNQPTEQLTWTLR